MTIHGTVDEYEPDTFWIELKNIKEKDVIHFNELVFRLGHFFIFVQRNVLYINVGCHTFYD